MERRVPVKYEVKGRDNETGEMVNVLVIQVFCAIFRIPDFILYNIELGLLQFFVLRLFFLKQRNVIWLAFSIMEALGQKVDFKGTVLDHFEMITVVKARGGKDLN